MYRQIEVGRIHCLLDCDWGVNGHEFEVRSDIPGSDTTLSSGPHQGYLELAASFSEVAAEDVARPAAASRRAPCVGSWTLEETTAQLDVPAPSPGADHGSGT
jgi:hypothetical protein